MSDKHRSWPVANRESRRACIKHQHTKHTNMAFTALNTQPPVQPLAQAPLQAAIVPIPHPQEIDAAFASNHELRKRVHAAIGMLGCLPFRKHCVDSRQTKTPRKAHCFATSRPTSSIKPHSRPPSPQRRSASLKRAAVRRTAPQQQRQRQQLAAA
jgi:hypothetical protein